MRELITGYAPTLSPGLNGRFASILATTLRAHATVIALSRVGVDPAKVQRVLVGHVLQGGAGQKPARQSAGAAGIYLSVAALTLSEPASGRL